MTYRAFSSLLAATLLSCAALGCGGARGADDGEELGAALQAEETENGLTENALTMNSLSMNSLSMNSLSMNSLSMNSLSMNSLVSSALTDPAARTVLKYIVGCALPADQSVTLEIPAGSGDTYTYSGQVGLYPSWSTTSCPVDTCQPWVSACVIARINAVGHVVPLSIRGAALSADGTEQSVYPDADGVFFGNVFTLPQIRYACLPDGVALTRTCGTGVAAGSCTAVQYLGACSSVCDTQAADGSWQSCWTTPAPHAGGTLYPASVSVFLQSGQIVP
jgi:hypothetical protein